MVRALAAVAAVGALVGAPLFTSLEGLPSRRDDLEWGVVLLDIMFVAVLIQMLACLYWLTQRHGQPSRKGDRDPFITAVQTPDTGGGGLLVVSAADNEASTSLALGQLSTLVAVTAMRLSRPRPGKCA